MELRDEESKVQQRKCVKAFRLWIISLRMRTLAALSCKKIKRKKKVNGVHMETKGKGEAATG